MSIAALLVSTALAATPPAVGVGEPALSFVLPALNEDVALSIVHRPTVALSDFTGLRAPVARKAVVLTFLDRDRGGALLDDLDHIQKRWGGRGVQVLAVVADEGDVAELSTWVADQRLAFPVVRDSYGIVTGRYGVTDLPMTFVIDGDGAVFAIGQPPAQDFVAEVEAELQPLVKR